MGKFNEIQDEKTQSWGGNSFTTTVKEDTVEFDSAKDKFTFKDEVEVPSLKVNGESVSSQVQADWNQNNSEAVDYIKNKPTIASQVQSDWNQSDNTSADYIKNRICYDERQTSICAETTFDGNGSINSTVNASIKITAGNYQIVIGDYEEVVNVTFTDQGSGHTSCSFSQSWAKPHFPALQMQCKNAAYGHPQNES